LFFKYYTTKLLKSPYFAHEEPGTGLLFYQYRKPLIFYYMLKTEHIGIAVKDLSASVSLFEKLLQTSCYKTEIVESEKVATVFLQVG